MAIELGVNANFSIAGDGMSTVFTVDVARLPLTTGNGNGEYVLRTNRLPQSVVAVFSTPSATATISGTSLVVTFSSAPPSGSATNCNILLGFNGD